jgi:hypothetical protein
MSFTATTLAADLSATSNKMVLTSGTGFAEGQVVKIDGEYARVASVSGANVSLTQRGSNGTAVVAHDVLSTVITTADNTDWTALQAGASTDRPPFVDDVISVGENGSIACPTRNATIMLTKATALATTTLADPPKDRDGLRLTVTSATDAAHVITGTFADGTTGAHTTATYAAFNGASMVLVAQQGVWNTVSLEAVTIS